jgi:hypothetical protein
MKNLRTTATTLFAVLMTGACSSASLQKEVSPRQNPTRTVASEDVSAKAETFCPSDIIKPFSGEWKGTGLLIPAQGSQAQSQSKDEFAVVDCQSFKVTVNYLNDSGAVVRTIDFIASMDPSGQPGLFDIIDGTMTEGSSRTNMSGYLRQIQDGTLLLMFSGALGGQPAYFTELMNLTAKGNEMVRTLQIFSGKRGGPFFAARVTTELRLQASQ